MGNFKYYNQNDYENIPYPRPSNSKSNVKTGGCGVVCASMIVENLTGKSFSPVESASYSLKNGARDDYGTNLLILGKAISNDFGLDYSTTNSIDDLWGHLKSGGMAVANVGGDYGNYKGVFSDGGHFIVVAGINEGGNLIILDPGYYQGKFEINNRYGKVEYSNYPELYVNVNILDTDCKIKATRYYLFSDSIKTLVNSVSSKIGLSSPSYWLDVLKGKIVVKTEYVKTVFKYILDKIGVLYDDSNLVQKVSENIALNSTDLWNDFFKGKVQIDGKVMIALFKKIDYYL